MPASVRFRPPWAAPRRADPEEVSLGLRRIYILPTRHGLLLAFFLALMLVGSINYNLSLGYVLTFLLATLAVISVLHAFRNVAGLAARPGRADSAFAGEIARFRVHVGNPGRIHRMSLGLSAAGQPPVWFDVEPGGGASVALPVPAEVRGRLRPGPVRLSTRFPLGLFEAWSVLRFDLSALVYPRPESGPVPAPPKAEGAGGKGARADGAEDFRGLRPSRPEDPLRHIAWKAAARDDTLRAKQFDAEFEAALQLDWSATAGLGTEARLSRLARWCLDAQASGATWTLQLPGRTIGPDRGDPHLDACLAALALHGIDDA